MLKRKYLLLTALLLILSFSTSGQDTAKEPIVPLDTGIAKEIVKDLERYDLCVIERRSLLNEASILNEKLDRKDSLLKFHRSVNQDLKLIIKNKNKRIDLEKKRSSDLKNQRNLAIGGGLLGIILTALIVGN